ncbi:hypothetical protein EDC01DRAFT_534020 [Geopyxis carbonaria]|nr:hypothetical protein EDC01DRAFT_534020 [Geopyxis carbonaria]
MLRSKSPEVFARANTTNSGGPSGTSTPSSGLTSDLRHTTDDDITTYPLRNVVSRHVKVVDERPNNSRAQLRERQWRSANGSRPSMVRSSSAYSARSAYSRAQTSGARTPLDPHSPRASMSTLHLQHLLETLEMDQYDTFGVEEVRDGFFDATFYRSAQQRPTDSDEDSYHDGSLKDWLKELIHAQYEDIRFFYNSTFQTENGITLFKAFIGYFCAYILCLVPAIQVWLGRYSYWITIATLFNHAGRPTGSQIDGTIACIFGGAFGLAIGSLALQLSSLTDASRDGYGGVLAAFLIPIIAIMSWIRCSLLRFYQAMMTAGLAIIFLCLVETVSIASKGEWDRTLIWEFAIPWLIGIGICLVVNLCILPEGGGKAVAFALHNATQSALEALVLPRNYSLEIHSNMGAQLVNLSDAVRDMRNEVTITTISPDDVEQLRNKFQAMIRDIMALKPETHLFENTTLATEEGVNGATGYNTPDDVVIQIESNPEDAGAGSSNRFSASSEEEIASKLVCNVMSRPSRELITTMVKMLQCCDSKLMRMMGQQNLVAEQNEVDVALSQMELRIAMEKFDTADISLIGHPSLPASYSFHPEIVELFLFIHPLRQAAGAIDNLASKVLDISNDPKSQRRRLFLPSYPLKKAIYRTNPQVRHDRGGVSAGYYFRIKQEIEAIMDKVHARAYVADPERAGEPGKNEGSSAGFMTAEKHTLRYRMWKISHRLQQFESRFAFKVVLVTVTLSVPAWVEQSRYWWSEYESWWAVVAAWFMMHPRVGGNLQDLFTRVIATVAGAIWGGLAYAAASASGRGRPYVLAVFAALFMFPAIFRFIISSHARSGLMACLSFTVVSLSAYNDDGAHPTLEIAWTRGTALMAGVVAAVIVNWLVWPFVARHELRKSLSSMLLSLGTSYRGVVARKGIYITNPTTNQRPRISKCPRYKKQNCAKAVSECVNYRR